MNGLTDKKESPQEEVPVHDGWSAGEILIL